MKILATLFLLAIPTAPVLMMDSDQDAEVRIDKATQVASAWLDSAFRGDTAVTTALSGVPFAFDRKRTIESITEVEELLEAMVASKGKRTLDSIAVKVIIDEDEIQRNSFPANYIVVFIQVDEGGDGVSLCVRPGDTYKVVGISD